MKINESEIKKEYLSKGLVYGNYWGGGKGSYKAKNLTGESKELLIKRATEMLDGRLDSGMGYESLIGALLEITTFSTIIINDLEYMNSQEEIVFIGDLTEEDKDFLELIYDK